MPIRPHRGDMVERVVIEYPDFVRWWLMVDDTPGLRWLHDMFEVCIEIFDNKPFTVPCAGKVDGSPCTRPVTRFSLYPQSCNPAYWCEECDPGQRGSSKSLEIGRTYEDALLHVQCYTDRRPDKRAIIKDIARAKGLTGNLTDQKILAFFYGG